MTSYSVSSKHTIFLIGIFLCLFTTSLESQNNWTWVHGSTGIRVSGKYGAMGVPSPLNQPGSRSNSNSWTDLSGNLWLYGGFKIDSISDSGESSDLWKFDVATTQWTWISGVASVPTVTNSANNGSGICIYGTKGVAAPSNTPGRRSNSATWVDGNGDLWLFGGNGADTVGVNSGPKNDLWKYNIATNMWTWVAGTKALFATASYGTQGVISASNVPGGRSQMVNWKDANGNFWIFGGGGCTTSTTFGTLNDLWKYDMSLNQWVWMKGSAVLNGNAVYGTLGVGAAANTPGPRREAYGWTDKNGLLWLFGGFAYDANHNFGSMNDLWRYNPATNQWTWMKGSKIYRQLAVYGTMNTPAPANTPGGTGSGACWTDSLGYLWLGNSLSTSQFGSDYYVNTMWKYNTVTNEWTWVKGPNNLANHLGNYGTRGVQTISNIPGGRAFCNRWIGKNGEFWMYAGIGLTDINPSGNILNDLWRFDPCYTNTVSTISSAAATATTCSGATASLSASGSGTITWYDLNANVLASGNTFSTPNLTVNTTYLVNDNSSCLPTSITVTVMPNPTVTISSPTIVCQGSSITLGASGASTYTWNTGALTRSITVSPSVTTTYSVSASNSPSGCTSNAVKTISVSPSPTVTASATNTLFCTGGSATLTASGATTYSWSTGSTSQSMTISPTVSTSYTVTGTGAGSCKNTATLSVTVYTTTAISVNSGSICYGQSFTMTPTGASSYTYSGGSQVVTPGANTIYTITGSNPGGCVAAPATSSVSVYQRPATFVPNGTVCSGQSFTLAPSGASSYTYSSGSAVVSPSSTTTYTTTGINIYGCTASFVNTVNVNPGPALTANNGTVCSGQSFTIIPSGAGSYTYSSGGPVVTPSSTSIFTISATGSNSCTGSVTSTVTVNLLPNITINPANAALCTGQTMTLTALGAGSYTWSNSQNTPGIVVSPAVNTSYTVTGVDANGCSNTASGTVSINPLPNVTTSSSNTVLCAGQTATLTASGATTYTWNNSQNTPNIAVSPANNTTYTVTGTDMNGCLNTSVITQTVAACTGLETFTEGVSLLSLYPNPVSDNLHLVFKDLPQNTTIELYNTMGALILSEPVIDKRFTVQLSQVPAGVYTIKVTQNNRIIAIQKVVKE